MDISFNDFIDILDGEEFDERPVDLKTFIMSKDYLGQPPLSEEQFKMVEASCQIYKESTLIKLFGDDEGRRIFKQTKKEVIAQWGKGCHAPYTPIFNTVSGKWEPLSSIGEGSVATMSGNRYSTESFQEGFGEMVRIKTSLGFIEDVHIGHKYYWFKKNKFYKRNRDGNTASFNRVSNISVGDRIGIGLGMEVENPINIPIEHAELIGYWLGDRMLPADHNKTMNMDFNLDEKESISRYLELVSFIGDTVQTVNHKDKHMISFRHSSGSNAVKLASEYGLWGMRSKTKYIPDAVWKGDNSVLSAVVSKLWQTDGCVYSKNGLTAEFVSVSEKLAEDVHHALLRLGIPSTIRSRIPKSNFANASRAWYVTVTSQECLNRFAEKIHLLDHERISDKLDKSGRVYSRIIDNVYFDRVVSIEKIEDGEYWTRTVPDAGHYIGNGMISANSGKDHSSTIAVSYIVYMLLCLKDPATYYGKPPGDAIDILNIAINSQQASNVFFKGFKNKIDNSPWFVGKYDPKASEIKFDKGITVHSGHSEREAWEGYNVLIVILDEIAGFAIDNTSGNVQSKTAEAIYDMYRASVDSRFPDFGKVILLSFPRYKNDFIQQSYDAAVAEKETALRTHLFKVNDDLPDGVEGNEFTVEWEEDHIVSYTSPRVYASKRTTWDTNPRRTIEDFKDSFFKNPVQALSRFACMPPDAIDAFFKSREKIEKAFSIGGLAVDRHGRLEEWFKPEPDKDYFIHVDLAQKHDHCAVTMSHVDSWVEVKITDKYSQPAPIISVDAVMYWTPTADKSVDFEEVKKYILSLKSHGFNIKLCTFDRWNSHDMMQQLEAYGIKTEILSVAKKHYDDMAMVITEERVKGPHIELLINELLQLKIIRDKVDHPRSGSKDLADATCGSIFNSISRTVKKQNQEITIHTYETAEDDNFIDKKIESYNLIKPPKKEYREQRFMPEDLQNYFEGIDVI